MLGKDGEMVADEFQAPLISDDAIRALTFLLLNTVDDGEEGRNTPTEGDSGKPEGDADTGQDR